VPKEKLFGGRWKVLGSLKEGGQSWVYRAIDTKGEFEGVFALKRLKNKDRVARFRTEIEILRRLQDPHIVKLVDAGVREHGSDEDSFLVMAIAANGDLDDRLELYKDQIESVVTVALQVATALDHAHKEGVVHRDIKPGNILFPSAGHDILVADFGISIDLNAIERNTPDGEIVGPRVFIAPELTEFGVADVKPAADIYSLGQVIFYMLSGGEWVSRLNVLDKKHDGLFSKGERHRLLRLLLTKMIAPLDQRYSEIKRVITDLEQIEAWEQSAVKSLLDPQALASTARLQHRVSSELQRQADAKAIRKSELELSNEVIKSVSIWLAQQLAGQTAALNAGDVLVASVGVNEPLNRQQLKVDTGNETLLEESDVVSLSVRIKGDAKWMVYSLRLHVCNEVHYNRPYDDPYYLGQPGNPMLAVLPMYEERSDRSAPGAASERGYFLGRHRKYGPTNPIPLMGGMTYHRQMVSHSYHDGSMSITRFNASEWPAARDEILKMVGEVLSRMIRHIEQQGN
jgi:serine/threonine protein kinase